MLFLLYTFDFSIFLTRDFDSAVEQIYKNMNFHKRVNDTNVRNDVKLKLLRITCNQ